MQYHQQQQIISKKQVKGASNNAKQIDQGKQKSLQMSSSQSSSLQISQLQNKRLMTDQSQSQISNRLILFQQLQNNSSNCLFCNKCRKSTQFGSMISTALYSKYSASQNYYFTKDINDILAGQHTSAVIRLKDIQAYDDQEEFLNRLYLFHEYDNKIKRLTEYYKFHRDIARLFMIPITNTLNKYHDKKRRIYYIQITRMLKDKENQGNKDEKKQNDNNAENNINEKNEKIEGNILNNEKDEEFEGQNVEIQKNKKKQKKKDEKDFNIKDKSNGVDLQKSFDMNERFLAPLDDIDESTKTVQCNTLQELNNKLNDILMNSTKSMQSYFFDQDVSQSIGNLSNFLNHLKTQNSQQQISIPQQQQKFSENNNGFVGKDSNTFISFDPLMFQNILLNQDQKNIQPTLLKNQFTLSSQQSSDQDTKSSQNLIANSQSIKQFLKKDSFLKKTSNEQQQPAQQNNIQQNQKFSIPISSGNKILTEDNLLQQIQKNNSPQSNQKALQELQKQNQGSKTDRGHYNQKTDGQSQNQIQKINQEMIQLKQPKTKSGSQSTYSSIGNKEGQLNTKDQQQQGQNKNIILSGNQIQLTQFDDKHISHLKTQSLNQGGFIIYQDNKGNIKKIGSSGNNILNQGLQNQKTSEKNSVRQSVKDGKNNEYPSNNMSEFPSGKQSQNQSIERNSLNSLQQSINGLIKQASKGVGSSTSSAEQSQIGLQSKLASNTSSKYSSSQNRQDSKQSVQQQKINNSKTPQQQKQSDLIVNKKINNLVLSDHQNSKKQQISIGGSISQIPIPTNSFVQQIILNQQSQQIKQQSNQDQDKSNQDKSFQEKQYLENQQIQLDNQQKQQEKQKSLSQQLSQQFQQQFSQQLQSYQRSQIQELQQQSTIKRQLSQGKNELKNQVDGECAPYTDRSQYTKKNNSQNLGYQKTLSSRDREQNSNGLIDLNAQKLKTQEAIYSRRDNQFDITSYQRNNTDNNLINSLINNQNDLYINPSQIQFNQILSLKQQNELKNIQQSTKIQNLIQSNATKNSNENIKSQSNLLNFGQNNQHIPTHMRTQTLESYRENNLNSQENTQSNSQSHQTSRNQSKNKNQTQQYPLPPTSQFGNQSQIQSYATKAQINRQGSQQKNQISTQIQQQTTQQYQQQQLQNENIYFKQSDQEQNQVSNQLRMQSSVDFNQIQNRQQDQIQNQSKQNEQQSQNNQIYLKKSLSNYKFENIGELKQIYKEVQKRTADMFQKHKEVQKTVQNTVTNQSIQDIQYQKSNTQRQKNNYYTKAELTTHKKGSQTQRGYQNSQDQSSSKESPRIHRIQKTEQSQIQNNSLMKLNSDRDQNQRRVSSQIKSSNNFNNSSSQIQLQTGGVQVQLKQQQQPLSQINVGGNTNIISASQLQMVQQQIQHNSREQALTTTQKKLQYKQQASKNSSESNSRMIHSNPNVEFNKTSYITSYNNSVNNTNIFAPANYNQSINPQHQAQSAYSSVINTLGNNSQAIVSQNTQLQNNSNSQQNSSKKILDKIKHTRINSMNAASLQQSQNSNQFNNQLNFKSSITSQTYRQLSSEYGKQVPQNLQPQQQNIIINPNQYLVQAQNNTTQKKIQHKYNKSEADSLLQLTQQQNTSQNIASQTNLGQNQMVNINQNENQKQLQKFQETQSQGFQQIPQTQQLSQQPSSSQLQQKVNKNIIFDNTKIPQQVYQQTLQTQQNSQSPERNSYNSIEKKNNEQYVTYANNNIINIFVNSHQENVKTIQQTNLINNHAQNLQQNIHSMINTQINLNKNVLQNAQQAQKTQQSPAKKANSNIIQRLQPDSLNNIKL